MSRGRMTHNINASLIHEARMILQQFLGGRQENYYSMRIAEARAKAAPTPSVCTHTMTKCCFCIEKPSNAIYVIDGYSVCGKHAPFVREEEYANILERIQSANV